MFLILIEHICSTIKKKHSDYCMGSLASYPDDHFALLN